MLTLNNATTRATDNLRWYLQEARLPPMRENPAAPSLPAPGHKSHINHLRTRAEEWRRLENIYAFNETTLEDATAAWIDSQIPSTSLGVLDEDPVSGENITVPCPPTFDIPYRAERPPADITRISPWLDNLPMMTVQRIIHLIFPDTFSWEFRLETDFDVDGKLFRQFVWTKTLPEEETIPAEVSRKSLVVAFQPPWILSEQDIKDFAACRTFPPFRLEGNAFPTELASHERIWAKIWDNCVHRNIPFFILTSYTHWVFGVFSAGWTSAFVTGAIRYDSHDPTVLERLTFWVATAMRLAGHYSIPKVPEPVTLGPIHIPDMTLADYATPANSESNWGGDDEFKANPYLRDMSPIFSDGGIPGHRVQTLNMIRLVDSWIEDKESVDSDLESIVPPQQPTRASNPFGPFIYQGDWLTPA